MQVNGGTPLFFAALDGHTEAVKFLLTGKAEVNKADVRKQLFDRLVLLATCIVNRILYACTNSHVTEHCHGPLGSYGAVRDTGAVAQYADTARVRGSARAVVILYRQGCC